MCNEGQQRIQEHKIVLAALFCIPFFPGRRFKITLWNTNLALCRLGRRILIRRRILVLSEALFSSCCAQLLIPVHERPHTIGARHENEEVLIICSAGEFQSGSHACSNPRCRPSRGTLFALKKTPARALPPPPQKDLSFRVRTYCAFESHICWKEPREARIDPPIQT
jgi:hypothetical protein